MENLCSEKSLRKNIFISIFLALPFTIFLLFYVDRVSGSESSTGLLDSFSVSAVFLTEWFIILFFILLFLILLLLQSGRRVGDFLYRYRYLICVAVFIFCVCFEISGSSIGVWNEAGYLGGEDTGLLLGTSRSARSDEWFVSTPMALSQYLNPEGEFSYFSSIVRGKSTDVFLEYGQPVRDIAVLFRPFHWGYLFLSPGKGLAFFWCGRWIALFLVSFEMGMLITGKDRLLSTGYAVLLTLSPTVQWWFAVNGLVEMLVFSQLSILMLHRYLTEYNTAARAVYAGVIFICAGGFILTLYPAWMVPVALVLLGLIIWQFVENLRHCILHKRDVFILCLEAAVFICIFAHIYNNSKDTIDALLNTVYPGSRFENGGGDGRNLFNYLSEIWYPMTGDGTMVNASESAQFIDFFPICYVIPCIVLFRDKIKDRLLISLLIFGLFLECYIVVGIPDLAASLTLMSYSTAHRTLQVAGFCNLLLLFRSLSMMKKKIHPAASILTAAAAVLFGIFQNMQNYSHYYEGRIAIAVVSGCIFYLSFWIIMNAGSRKTKKIQLFLICCISFSAGALVNPVRTGVDNITENVNIQEVQAVVQSDPTALWAIEELGIPMTNAGIMAGAPTINSTNIYPALKRWKAFDNGENEEIYNRYAHICIHLQEKGELSFELLGPDYIQVNCTLDDLRAMGVTYVWTINELEEVSYDSRDLTLVSSWDAYRIYKIQ